MSIFRLRNRRKPLRHARKIHPTPEFRGLSMFFRFSRTGGQSWRLPVGCLLMCKGRQSQPGLSETY